MEYWSAGVMEMLFGLSGNIDNAVAFDGKGDFCADNASCYCRFYSAQHSNTPALHYSIFL
jgi:hypothetical protein